MLTNNNRSFVHHIEGFFDPALLINLREHFIHCETEKSLFEALSEREKKAMDRGESSDNMRMQDCWYDVWRYPMDSLKLINFFKPYELVTYPVQVRHITKEQAKVPWHQDIGYMRLLENKGHEQVMTCFIPLELEPSQCTTIEFAFNNREDGSGGKELTHTQKDGFGAGIEDFLQKERKHFNLSLGDALAFGDFAVHRTYTPEACQLERRSLEFRLIQPAHMIPGKDYFHLSQKKFVTLETTNRREACE